MAKIQAKTDASRGDAAPAAAPAGASRGAVPGGVERMPVRAVQRAFDLLALVGARRGGVTLSELARGAALPVSTTARLIATLEHAGFVERDDGGYRAGPRLLQVGLTALRGSSLYEISEPFLRHLSEASGETANLAVRIDPAQAVYLRQVVSPKSIHHATWLGRTLPLDCTAVGGALLGRADGVGYVAMRDTLERDVTAVAAPVRDASNSIVGAFSITGPSFRISDDDIARFGALVVDAARSASSQL